MTRPDDADPADERRARVSVECGTERPPRPSHLLQQRIGRMLRRHRERAGLLLADAGRQIERSASTISVWESGKRTPRLVELTALLTVYTVETAEMRDILDLAGRVNRPDQVFAELNETSRSVRAYYPGRVPSVLADATTGTARALFDTEPPWLDVLLDESWVRRARTRDRAVLERIVEISRARRISVWLLPPGPPVPGGSVFVLPRHDDPDEEVKIVWPQHGPGRVVGPDEEPGWFETDLDAGFGRCLSIADSLAVMVRAVR